MFIINVNIFQQFVNIAVRANSKFLFVSAAVNKFHSNQLGYHKIKLCFALCFASVQPFDKSFLHFK